MAAESPDKSGAELQAARALQSACEQIGLAMRESQAPVDVLSEALSTLGELLNSGELRASQPERLKTVRAQLQRAIISLQFHDRMAQRLGHVQDYLNSSARKLGAAADVNDTRWTGLHRQLDDRLQSVPSAGGSASPPGDIDLF